MTIWGLIQVVINIFLFVGLFVCIVRSPRRNQDDPRLSRGLQLLQSKISVLEDLSDKTDLQFQKMTSLLEQKITEVQQTIAIAERHLKGLQAATEKGIETTRLVQTGLGAERVVEMHTNEIYAQAAQLAFEGKSIEEICQSLDLPRGEVELIVKFNRDSLRTGISGAGASVASRNPSSNLNSLFEVPQFDASSLNKLGEEFRRVTREAEEQTRYTGFSPKLEQADFKNDPPVLIPPSFQESKNVSAASSTTALVTPAAPFSTATVASTQASPVSHQESPSEIPHRSTTGFTVGGKARELNSAPVVRKVVFPRIESQR